MSNSKTPPPLVQALIMIAIAIGSLMASVHFYRADQALTFNHVKVMGKIDRVNTGQRNNGGRIHYEVDGKPYDLSSGGFFSATRNAQVGAEFELMVSNTDPTNACVNSFADRHTATIAFAVMFLLTALIGYKVMKKNL